MPTWKCTHSKRGSISTLLWYWPGLKEVSVLVSEATWAQLLSLDQKDRQTILQSTFWWVEVWRKRRPSRKVFEGKMFASLEWRHGSLHSSFPGTSILPKPYTLWSSHPWEQATILHQFTTDVVTNQSRPEQDTAMECPPIYIFFPTQNAAWYSCFNIDSLFPVYVVGIVRSS